MLFQGIASRFAGKFRRIHLVDQTLRGWFFERPLVQRAHQAKMLIGGALVGLPQPLAFRTDGKIESVHFGAKKHAGTPRSRRRGTTRSF